MNIFTKTFDKQIIGVKRVGIYTRFTPIIGNNLH